MTFAVRIGSANKTWLGYFLGLSALAVGAFANAQTAPVKPPEQVTIENDIRALKQQLDSRQFDAILADAQKKLEADATNSFALVSKALALYGKGDLEGAFADAEKAIAKAGEDIVTRTIRAEAYICRSKIQYDQGKFLPAVDSAFFAILARSDNANAYVCRSNAYVERRQFDRAINTANQAIYYDANSGEAYAARGAAYAGHKNWDQAIADQTKAVQLNAQLARAYELRAAAYVQKKDYIKAYQDAEQALKIDPTRVDALGVKAALFVVKKDLGQSFAQLDTAVAKNPNSAKALYLRGAAHAAQKDWSKALDDLNKALEKNPAHALALVERGNVYLTKKDADKAIADFSKAIETDPKLAAAYAGRKNAYLRLNKADEAKADHDKLTQLEPPPPPKGSEKKKKAEEPLARFVPQSKAVEPSRRDEAKAAAAKIDALVEANYTKHGVKANALTTDEQFVRRVYLDIVGSIPTMKQTRKFTTSTSPDKRAELIDELLSSTNYAGHFFNYWADILRYTDSLNNSVRGEPYRQWIKQSLAENKPWDKMVHEMITAEGLIWSNPATGYLQRDPGMPLDNMNNTVRIFLGTRIGCAQCHDHPFDRWKQKEFYQMAAFTFGTVNSTHGGDSRYWSKDPNPRLREDYDKIVQEEEDRRNNSYRFDRVIGINMMMINDVADRKIRLPKDYAYSDAKPDDVIEPKTLFGPAADLKPGVSPRKAFADWLVSKDNPRFSQTIANRLWKQAFGVGQIEPVDDVTDLSIAENPELMKFLDDEMKRVDFDMKQYLRSIYYSQTYQRQACTEEIPLGAPYHFPGPVLRRMTAEQIWDSLLTLSVVDPDEYRELPANLRTQAMGLDLVQCSAQDVLDAEDKANNVDYGLNPKRQQKYMYKGQLLARAAELPSPSPANHFLRAFGQSDREQIAASSTSGSVPQVLFMFNGPFTHMLLEKNSTIYNNVVRSKTPTDQVRAIFLTILSREPEPDELELAKAELKKNGPAGAGDVIWSLLNTREFMFVQ